MPSARPGRRVARRWVSTYRSMAARSGVPAPGALAAAVGGPVAPTPSRTSMVASATTVPRRVAPADRDRIQLLIPGMLVFIVSPLPWLPALDDRSEEHTSELQSRGHL